MRFQNCYHEKNITKYLQDMNTLLSDFTEAVVWRCSVEKVLIEISQKSQEITYVRVSFLIKLQASACEISKTTSGQLLPNTC